MTTRAIQGCICGALVALGGCSSGSGNGDGNGPPTSDSGPQSGNDGASEAGPADARTNPNDAGATTDGGPSVCPSLGWCELPNTTLAAVCPDPKQYPAIQAYEGCSGVINDWSGAAADTLRNRLVIWGGGHKGYFGNEVYALDLNHAAMVRLNDPSDVTGYDFTNCYAPDAYGDGRPVSRHTYDGVSYVAHADKMFSFSGAKAPCGYQDNDTWTLDLSTVSTAPSGQAPPWTLMKPTLNPPNATLRGAVGVVSDYDPNTKAVIMANGIDLWAYSIDTNTYASLNNENAFIDYHMTGRVDPKRKLFVVVGSAGSTYGGVKVFDIGTGSNYAMQDWTTQVTGCDGLVAASYPGLAYDSHQDRMIGWAGGNTVYLFDLDSKSCTTTVYNGGPGPQNANGTMGRFRYFPSLNVFAVVNDSQRNGYALRMTP